MSLWEPLSNQQYVDITRKLPYQPGNNAGNNTRNKAARLINAKAIAIGRVIPNETQMPRAIPKSVRVANIIKRELDVGTFDDTCMKDEMKVMEDWVWKTLIFDAPVEEV